MQITNVDSRHDFHVVPAGAYWSVEQENNAEPDYISLTKTEALGLAIEQARIAHVSVVIHGRDGRIQNVWSYDLSGPSNAWMAGVLAHG